MTQKNRKDTKFGTLKNWIIGITSVLIAVPALINAMIDIVVHVKKLPRTQAESMNLEMFKKHWGKDALAGGAVPVKTTLGMVDLEFRVYAGGNIFTKYGSNSKWFPSPLKPKSSTSLFVSSAHAQTLQGSRTQTRQFKTNTPVKGRYTAEIAMPRSNKTKVYKVDPLTGTWNADPSGAIRTGVSTPDGLGGSTSRGLPSYKYRKFPTIDLTKK